MKSSYASYISALLLFGSNGIIASFIDLPSTAIVFYRTGIGSLFLLLMFIISRNNWTFYKQKKQFYFLAISGIAMGASWMFLYEAYQQVGVSISSLIYYCGPVIVMSLSPVLFKEKLTPRKITGFLCVLIGIILLNGFMMSGEGIWFGVFCGIMSACTYAVMVIFNKKAPEITGLENSLLQLIFSFVAVSIYILINQVSVFNISNSDILPVMILGVINTGLGCYLYFSKLYKLPVQSVSILGYLEPLSAVILSLIFLNENLTLIQVLGALLILGGASFSEFKLKK